MRAILAVMARVSDVEDGYPCRGRWVSLSWRMVFPRRMVGILVVGDRYTGRGGSRFGRGGWASLSWRIVFPRRMMGILVVEDRFPSKMMGILDVQDGLTSTNDGHPCRGGSPFGRGGWPSFPEKMGVKAGGSGWFGGWQSAG